MVLIDRAASEHKRRRKKGTRLSRSRKPVTTLRGILGKPKTRRHESRRRREKQKTVRMIVVPLGAHLGVFSVLQRLRSVILTSLPPLSCQSPLPRSKRQTLLAWAASVPGAESKKAQVYHVYPTCAARTCILWAFSLFGFYIDLILRFSGVTLLLWGCR